MNENSKLNRSTEFVEKYFRRCLNDADTTVITRRDAYYAAVMSLEYYNGLMGTVHLLRTPANAQHLNQYIEQYKQGKVRSRELLDE